VRQAAVVAPADFALLPEEPDELLAEDVEESDEDEDDEDGVEDDDVDEAGLAGLLLDDAPRLSFR